MSLESLLQWDIGVAIEAVRSIPYVVLRQASDGTEDITFSSGLSPKIDSLKRDTLRINTSFDPEIFSGPMDSTLVPYEAESAYSTPPSQFSPNSDDEYWSITPVEDVKSETMSTPEAEVELKDIQYATVLGSRTELNYSERKRFSLWCLFNPSLRELFHSLYAITSEVDYGRVF